MNFTNVATQISSVATSAAGNSWALVSNFLILIALFIVFLLVSYRSRGGIISLILSFYIGYALYLIFPYTNAIVGSGSTVLVKAVLSIAIYAIGCFIPFLFVERLTTSGFGVLSAVPRIGLSILAAAFLMAVAYHVFHVSNIYTFPEPMNTLFAPNQYFFWWFVAPLIGLIVLVY